MAHHLIGVYFHGYYVYAYVNPLDDEIFYVGRFDDRLGNFA